MLDRIHSDSDQSSKRGGGKLNRSETVTVRLDPKLNYLCELAARAQRRTKSSFIEWAVAESLSSVVLPEWRDASSWDSGQTTSLADRSMELWHVDEADRVVALALEFPALLTHEEQLIWKIVRENGTFWKGNYDKSGEWKSTITAVSLRRENLRQQWDLVKEVAFGDRDLSALPTWQKQKAPTPFPDDVDDEVPF